MRQDNKMKEDKMTKYKIIFPKENSYIAKLNKHCRGRLRENGVRGTINIILDLFHNCGYDFRIRVTGVCDGGYTFELLNPFSDAELEYPTFRGITDVNVLLIPKCIAPNGDYYVCNFNWMMSIEQITQFKKEFEDKILVKPNIKYGETKWFNMQDCPLQ